MKSESNPSKKLINRKLGLELRPKIKKEKRKLSINNNPRVAR